MCGLKTYDRINKMDVLRAIGNINCILLFFFVVYRVHKESQGLLGNRVCLVHM